jgi:hypothetical protein
MVRKRKRFKITKDEIVDTHTKLAESPKKQQMVL